MRHDMKTKQKNEMILILGFGDGIKNLIKTDELLGLEKVQSITYIKFWNTQAGFTTMVRTYGIRSQFDKSVISNIVTVDIIIIINIIGIINRFTSFNYCCC